MKRAWMVVALAVLGVGCSSSSTPHPTTTTTSSTTSTSTTASATSTTVAAAPEPAEYVAVSPDGHLVAVSVATGAVIRQLEPAVPPGAPSDLALSADRQTLFFSRAGHLQKVPVAGGAATPVGTLAAGQSARWPAPTSDGKYLAWVRTTAVANGMATSDVMVTDLVTGAQRILVPNAAQPRELSWSGSGTRLVMQTNANVPVILTLSPTGAVVDQRNVTAPDPGCSFWTTRFVPGSDVLETVEPCQGTTPARGDTILVQAFAGQARVTVATLPPSAGVTGFALDRTGHFLLVATVGPAGDAASADLLVLHDGQQHPVPHAIPAPGVGGVTPVW